MDYERLAKCTFTFTEQSLPILTILGNVNTGLHGVLFIYLFNLYFRAYIYLGYRLS